MPTYQTPSGPILGYEDVGHGPALLFLHAFPLHSEMWRAQLGLFAGERRVVAVDFPGFGMSPAAGPGLTLATHAKAVAELARHLGLAPFAAIGLSMGGYVALELASQAPELLSGLVLADSRAGADAPEGAAAREKMAARAEREGIGFVAGEMLPRLLAPSAEPDVVRFARRLIARASPQGVATAQRAMAARRDHHATLERLRLPALVLCGAEDALTPPAESARMASRLSLGRLEILPGGSHLSNLDAEDAFNRALVSFLDQ